MTDRDYYALCWTALTVAGVCLITGENLLSMIASSVSIVVGLFWTKHQIGE